MVGGSNPPMPVFSEGNAVTKNDYSEGRFPKKRSEALTDGIFAIAMTIPGLGIAVPSAATYRDSIPVISSILPDLYHYTLALLMLMIFWILHNRQFGQIDQIDPLILWLYGISLLFIALIPFTSALSTEFHGDHRAPVFLEANLLIIGCIYAFFWHYSVKKEYIKPDVPHEQQDIHPSDPDYTCYNGDRNRDGTLRLPLQHDWPTLPFLCEDEPLLPHRETISVNRSRAN